ncbi:hypothetical protein C8Q75DRAFT_861802, partial [Abortiporus biennis]
MRLVLTQPFFLWVLCVGKVQKEIQISCQEILQWTVLNCRFILIPITNFYEACNKNAFFAERQLSQHPSLGVGHRLKQCADIRTHCAGLWVRLVEERKAQPWSSGTHNGNYVLTVYRRLRYVVLVCLRPMPIVIEERMSYTILGLEAAIKSEDER